MNMKWVISLTLLFSFKVVGQKADYLRIRDSLNMTCGGHHEETVRVSHRILLELDTNFIEKNRAHYYFDLGMSFYILNAFTKGDSLLQFSNQNYSSALYHNSTMSNALWGLAINFFTLKNCSKMNMYLSRYKECTRKKYWSKQEIEAMETFCK